MLTPGLTDARLTKDIGLIPYIMQKHRGYKAVYATYKPTKDHVSWPALHAFTEDVEFDYIEPSFDYRHDNIMQTVYGANLQDCSNDLTRYVVKNALDIDVLFIFGFYPYYHDCVAKYKELNPQGKVYLKLDANIGWINSTPVDERFTAFLKNCDLITSETLVEYLNSKWPVPVHYLPNGFYPLGETENRLERNVPFEEKEDYILTVGRLGTPQKATDLLLDAFKLAKPHIPDSWKLVLAGNINDSFMPFVQDFMFDNPDLLERVLFLGFIHDKKELGDWFVKSKIFALPSLFEGYANVLAEAKAHGCYLLASDIESSRDAASKHDNRRKLMDEPYKAANRIVEYGSLHEVSNRFELAQRMIEACNDQERLRSVCLSTQQDAVEYFDWIKLSGKIDVLLKATVN